MIKLICLFEIFLLVACGAFAQAPLKYTNVRVFGDGESTATIRAIDIDSMGNVFMTGEFGDAIDFDPSPGEMVRNAAFYNTPDGFVAKFDSLDNLIWAKTIRMVDGRMNDIALDPNGDIVLCGTISGTVHPDENNISYTLSGGSQFDREIFVAKFQSNGAFRWAHRIGSPMSDDSASTLIISAQNEIYLGGVISDSVDFDLSASNYYIGDQSNFWKPFLAKFDSSMALQWAFALSGAGYESIVEDVELTPAGNVMIAGRFSRSVDFDPSPLVDTLRSQNNTMDGFVAQYSSTGAYRWSFRIGGSGDDNVKRIAVGSNNEFYIGGYFENSVDLDPGPASVIEVGNNSHNAFLSSYQSNLAFRWGFGFGKMGIDEVKGLDLDDQQNLYAAGVFHDSVDFSPVGGWWLFGYSDGFIVSYDSSGNVRWANPLNGQHENFAQDVEATPTRRVTACGNFRAQIDLNPFNPGGELTIPYPKKAPFLINCDTSNGAYISGFTFDRRSGGDDLGYEVVHDKYGNQIACGTFTGEVDFDDGPGTQKHRSDDFRGGWIAKYHPYSGLQWSISLVDTLRNVGNFVTVNDIAVNDSGDIWVTGRFKGTVDFDPSPFFTHFLTSPGSGQPGQGNFIAGFRHNGSLFYADIYGDFESIFMDIAIAADNAPVIVGHTSGIIALDRTNFSNTWIAGNNQDVIVIKLDRLGYYDWGFGLDGYGYNEGWAVCTDSLGNIFIGGKLTNQIDFDPGAGTYNVSVGSMGPHAGFLASYDSLGTFRWAKRFENQSFSGSSTVYVLTSDSVGNIYCGGLYKGVVDLDFGTNSNLVTTPNTYTNVFVSSIDNLGDSRWGISFGGELPETIHQICHSKGNIFLSGNFTDTTDFDPGPASFVLLNNERERTFITSFDTAGNFLNAKKFDCQVMYGLSAYEREVVATGHYRLHSDFDPDTGVEERVGFGGEDIFLLHLGPALPCSSSLDTMTVQSCDPFLTPGGALLTSTTIHYDSMAIGVGCYSVLEVNYTRSPSFQDTLEVHGCYDYFNANSGQLITVEGWYTDTLASAFGCDSIVTIDVHLDTVQTNLQVSACDSIFWNGGYLYTSGTYYDTLASALNCDSVVVLDLNIGNSTSAALTVSACGPYTAPSGNTYTSSGTYVDIIPNAIGCDSSITIQLTINTVDTTVSVNFPTLTANASGASYQWIICGSSAIPGATNQSYTATASGSFAVIVTENGCTDTSGCYSLAVVGIIANDFGKGLEFWPNPTAGQLMVDLGAGFNAVSVVISNANGQEVTTKYFQSAQELELEIPGSSGIYMLEIKAEGGLRASFKVVKQ